MGFDPNVQWWVDDAPLRCHACTSRDHAIEAWQKANREDDKGGPQQAGALRWAVRQYHPEEHQHHDE